MFCKLKKASFKTETIVVPLKNNFTNEYYYKFYFSSSMIYIIHSQYFFTPINDSFVVLYIIIVDEKV